MNSRLTVFLLIAAFSFISCQEKADDPKGPAILKAEDFKFHVDYFNSMEDENIQQAIPNVQSWEWMEENIPLFECPQQNFQEIYYYRWWSLRKHIKETPKGYVMTEFLVDRPYADEYNMISCALGHHIYESRWLHNPEYLHDYVHVWFRGNEGGPMAKLRSFSSWTADALYNKFLVDNDRDFLVDMYPDLRKEYFAWEADRRLPSGLFWQHDVKDGMEESLSGGRRVQNARPTINSYMYGNAKAMAKIAQMLDIPEDQTLFNAKADTMKMLVEENLWNPESVFFETLTPEGEFAGVREAIGFIPWYFNLPENGHEAAWEQVKDKGGFLAPFGLTTAECRHPDFRSHGCCSCEWDGAIWPFATSQTMTAMANVLNDYTQEVVGKNDYFQLFNLYVESQYYRGRPYIGEYLDETTGFWLKGDQERSRYYNHSTFNDMLISGLVGLRPRADDKIEVNPLIPEDKWDWFCLDNVAYQGDILTIIWDKSGEKYNLGQGLRVLKNGEEIASSQRLEKILVEKKTK
ncbi:glycosyl hydrolase family 65 protein [Belliella marina]|uniref:Glycosyl hydrolase family 65 protein n=1 Tax=Belliella marina TaxID=1644146 RepID=A0ABW4VIE7_9BACT